jgi:deoxyribose-phosphate aldolase
MNEAFTEDQAARIALRCLDLTSLNDADTEADIERLCARALTPHGAVAAVCVWPRFVALARQRLPASVRVAAVANFPAGGIDVDAVLREVQAIVAAGAQEVDVVLPWRALQAGDEAGARQVLVAARSACARQVLKVILETGELADGMLIERASRLALSAGADFLKTSTGKVPVGATLAAADAMLRAIAAVPGARARVGIKLSGGLRKVADLPPYLARVERRWGDAALQPQRFRIGASSLLDDIEAVLDGRAAAAAADGY